MPTNKAHIITVYVQDFNYFVDNELSNIKKNTTLNIIDHETASVCISSNNYKNFLNNPNIIRVYAENWKDSLHPKIVIFPIGFESKATIDGNENKMIHISKTQKVLNDKPLKILCNSHFLIHTKPKSGSYNQRQEVLDKLKNNKLVDFWKNKQNKEATWKEHNNYSFELCPEGNGLDTHRFYEALLLNTIPIVKRNSLESMYIKFPCVIVDDWNEITEKNCIKWKNELKDRIHNEKYKLNMDFWYNKINQNIFIFHEKQTLYDNLNYFNKINNYHLNIFDYEKFKTYLQAWGRDGIIKACDSVSHPVIISDMFRLVMLYYFNGFYIDIKGGIDNINVINNLGNNTYFIKNDSNKITNWFIYSNEDNPDILKYIIDNITDDILNKTEIGNNYEEKVWNLSGPIKIGKLINTYEYKKIINSSKLDLVYDRRGSGQSWNDPNTYHKVNSNKSLYK
jgi:hypothetical protein